MFIPSHLAIALIDDVSNWKAWNILQSMERGSHSSASLGWIPGGKKEQGIRFGACFGWWTKELPMVWSRQFWSFHGFQSPTAFPRGPRGEKWRQIHGCIYAKILEDDCSFCHVLNFRGWFFKEGLHDKSCQWKNKSCDHKMLLQTTVGDSRLRGLTIAKILSFYIFG